MINGWNVGVSAGSQGRKHTKIHSDNTHTRAGLESCQTSQKINVLYWPQAQPRRQSLMIKCLESLRKWAVKNNFQTLLHTSSQKRTKKKEREALTLVEFSSPKSDPSQILTVRSLVSVVNHSKVLMFQCSGSIQRRVAGLRQTLVRPLKPMDARCKWSELLQITAHFGFQLYSQKLFLKSESKALWNLMQKPYRQFTAVLINEICSVVPDEWAS